MAPMRITLAGLATDSVDGCSAACSVGWPTTTRPGTGASAGCWGDCSVMAASSRSPAGAATCPASHGENTWRQADWPAGEEMEIEVGFVPAGGGTLVTIEVRGWERLTGGAEIGRGYGEGAKELLGWLAEAAAAG